MRTVDLFSGGGGMTLGFELAGADVVASFDNWKPAIEFHEANFKHPIHKTDLSSCWRGDPRPVDLIKKYDPKIIIGGPPCQDFSNAGKRSEGARADLTIDFANVVQEILPDYFVMENVARAEKSDAYKTALAIFKDDYGVTLIVLDASLCGCPQKRKRLFAIGRKGGPDDEYRSVLEGKLADKPMTVREYADFGIDHYYRHPRSYKRRGVFSVDEPSPTIRGVNRPIPKGYPGHSGDTASVDQVRPLTTRERATIQTFPADIKLVGCKTNVEQIIGNSVPVNLARFVAEEII